MLGASGHGQPTGLTRYQHDHSGAASARGVHCTLGSMAPVVIGHGVARAGTRRPTLSPSFFKFVLLAASACMPAFCGYEDPRVRSSVVKTQNSLRFSITADQEAMFSAPIAQAWNAT